MGRGETTEEGKGALNHRMPHDDRNLSRFHPFLNAVALGLAAAFFLASPWFYGLTGFRDRLAAELVIFFFFLLSFASADSQSFRLPRISKMECWVAATLILGGFYTLVSSIPVQSFWAFLDLLGGGLFYFLARSLLKTDKHFFFLLGIVLAVGLFYAGYGLFQYYGMLPHEFWCKKHSLASRYVNGGHFGAFLFFPLFSALSLWISARRFTLRLVFGLALFVMSWAIFLTRARGVWVALAAGLAVFFWALRHERVFNRRWVFGVAAIVLAGAISFLQLGVVQEVAARIENLWATNFYSWDYRLKLWQGCLLALAARPWGWGLGAFREVFPQFQVHSDRFLVDYAHNEFLHTAVDLGIPGLIFLVGFLVFYFRKAACFLNRPEAIPSRKIQVAGFLAVLTALVVSSQADFPLRIYATGLFFAVFLALSAYLWGEGAESPSQERSRSFSPFGRWKIFVRCLSVLLVIAAGIFTTAELFRQVHFEKGKKLEEELLLASAQTEYEKAARGSFDGDTHVRLGILYQKRSALATNPNLKKGFHQKAVRVFERVVRLEPYRGLTHYLLARLYETGGRSDEAGIEFEKAARLAPMNALFSSEYGYFLLGKNKISEAVEWFEKFQKIPFKEGTRNDPCEILRAFPRRTQNIEDLERVVSDGVSDHMCLGYVLAESGHWDEAVKEFALAREKDEKLSGFRNYMVYTGSKIADFYIRHERFPEALEIYQVALNRNPEDAGYRQQVVELSKKATFFAQQPERL